MSYTIEVYLNKKLTRAETKHILDSELPEKLKGDFWADQEWGFAHDMDVLIKEDEVKSYIELHAAYGHDYRDFLIAVINACLNQGFFVIGIKYYW
jgi:hypothetical protein